MSKYINGNIKITNKNKDSNSQKQEVLKFANLANEWLLYTKMFVKESTFSKYFYLMNTHIIPWFGELYIENITATICDQYFNYKLSRGKLNNTGGLSNSPVNFLRSILQLVLKFACRKYGLNLFLEYMIPFKQKSRLRSLPVLGHSDQQKLENYILSAIYSLVDYTIY